MTGICFHWEPPAAVATNSKAVKKLLLHWTHTAKCYGIRDIYCIDVDKTGVQMGDVQINFTVIESISDLEGKIIFVEQGGKPLRKFKHPENCIYVFGSDYGNLPQSDVSIESELGLYAEQACAIVLHDRYLKNGGHQ